MKEQKRSSNKKQGTASESNQISVQIKLKDFFLNSIIH